MIFKGRAGKVESLRRERRDIFSRLHLLPTCLEFRSVNQEALMEVTIQMCTSEGRSPPAPKHKERALIMLICCLRTRGNEGGSRNVSALFAHPERKKRVAASTMQLGHRPGDIMLF